MHFEPGLDSGRDRIVDGRDARFVARDVIADVEGGQHHILALQGHGS